MSFLDKSPAEEWDAVIKKRREEARLIAEAQKADERVAKRIETADKYLAKAADSINPSHYKGDGIECIDYIKQTMSKEAFLGYLEGNVVKYRHRYRNKNGIEDLRKARWYLDRLIEEQCNGQA